MRIPQISAALLFTLLLAGCQFHKTVFRRRISAPRKRSAPTK